MKKTKVKLSGVRTFNEFWFGSCYYHQLYSAVSCIGGNTDETLLLNLSIPRGNYEVDKVVLNKKSKRSIDYCLKRFNIDRKKLICLIEKGIPVIVGVDCYEIKDRIGMYHKEHCKHFVMVYGFDMEKGMFNITDHNYVNDYFFKEKEIPFDELIEANLSYRKMFCTKNSPSCMQVYENKRRNEGDFFESVFSREQLSRSHDLLIEDLERIKCCVEDGDNDFLGQNASKIIDFCSIMKQSKNILHCFKSFADMEILLGELVTCYRFLWSVLIKAVMKKDFDFIIEQSDKIVKKLDTLIENEKKLNRYLQIRGNCYGRII